jgi:hypothetical protein
MHSCILKSNSGQLSDLSSLTAAQVETLKVELAVRRNQITMEKALLTRKNIGITRGAHHRTLQQAKANIKEALFTLALAVHIGALNLEEAQKLILSASSIPDDLDPSKAAEVLGLLNALAERIVMPKSTQHA